MNTNQRKLPESSKHLCIIESGQKPDRACPKDAVTAEVGRHIKFKASILDNFDVKGCQPLHYDLLVLCAAVEFADRHWKRPQAWGRAFHLTIPVVDIVTWHRPEVLGGLVAVLRHVTGDKWQFNFVRAKNVSPIGERQAVFNFEKMKSFAVPYSDGLDSLSVSALSGEKSEALCIRVSNKRQRLQKGDFPFAQIPFKVEKYRANESSFRSRGFQFTLITAIAAQLSHVTRIIVPESGQGALGPVLLPLHNIYADYRNHPTFLRKMERFIQVVLGYRLKYEQPRMWFTKGQTLRAFLALPGKTEVDLAKTRSCWQKRPTVNVGGGRRQCGLCAACLLRRMSMHAAGVIEEHDAYVISDLRSPSVKEALSVIAQTANRNIMVEYGSVGVRHLQHLAEMSELSDDDLRIFVSEIAAATGATHEKTQNNLRTVLVSHAEEWRAFLFAQGEQSFLKSWMEGGRNVQSK
jgi:7-cyano-7-deazaguanine synthase in queuosine biosynthesis